MPKSFYSHAEGEYLEVVWAYYLGVSALFTHELDAVANAEWRLLFHYVPYLISLSDSAAMVWFITLHFPLFFYFGYHNSIKLQNRFRMSVSAFSVIHGILHFSLSHHHHYQFNGVISHFYIYAAGAFRLAFLVLSRETTKP